MTINRLPLALLIGLRFAGGMASAFVIVCASTLVLERLSAAGQGHLPLGQGVLVDLQTLKALPLQIHPPAEMLPAMDHVRAAASGRSVTVHPPPTPIPAGHQFLFTRVGNIVTGAISQAQKRVELQNFQARKRLLEYDDVMNQQREVVYSLRLFALERGEQLKAEATRMVDTAVERVVRTMVGDAKNPEDFDRAGLQSALTMQFLVSSDELLDVAKAPDLNGLIAAARAEAHRTLTRKIEYLSEFGKTIGAADVDMEILSRVMLAVLDEKWKDHLYDLDQLRNAIQYRAYGQKDPLVEYKKEAFEMFEDLMRDVHATFTERLLKIQVTAEPNRQPAPPPPGAFGGRRPAPPAGTPVKPEPPSGSDELFAPGARAETPAPPARSALPAQLSTNLGPMRTATGVVPEVGRNDPCPCGSGKKYKKCHGAGK